jgi:phosphate:Na+ symporter
MPDTSDFRNPFTAIGSEFSAGVERLDRLHLKPVSESGTLQEGLLIMVSKIIEMTRLLSGYVYSGSAVQMDDCYGIAKEIHVQEKFLTKGVVEAKVGSELRTLIIRFPFRLERIGDMLESVLNCCRIKATDDIVFSAAAHAELDQLFTTLLEAMNALRDAFLTPMRTSLEYILGRCRQMDLMLPAFRLAHWDRVEAGECDYQASSVYLDISDSLKSVSEYLEKMARTLLELGQVSS